LPPMAVVAGAALDADEGVGGLVVAGWPNAAVPLGLASLLGAAVAVPFGAVATLGAAAVPFGPALKFGAALMPGAAALLPAPWARCAVVPAGASGRGVGLPTRGKSRTRGTS
jgi:hypothetical protein